MTARRPDIDPEGRYSQGQAAVALGVSRMTIHRWTKAGMLKGRPSKLGGRLRYKGSDLIRAWASEY